MKIKSPPSSSSVLSRSHLHSGVELDDRVRVEVDLKHSLPPAWHHTFRWTHHHAWQRANI